MMKKRVFSGIRATGKLHLGNYLGAVKGMIELVNKGEFDCIFQVVDLHTITTPYSQKGLKESIKGTLLDYLGAGLPIEKCCLTVQSMVPEQVLLSYYLATIYSVNKLEDLPTFKEKKALYPREVNLGLLYYPILMAADILAYKAEKVPVGIDQEPHLEVAREVARKFNGKFGTTFPEPVRFATQGEYVPSLKGEGKMSKSVEGSYINLTDDEETVRRKIMSVATDAGTGVGKRPEGQVKTIFDLFKLFCLEKYDSYEKDYLQGKIQYRQMKEELVGAVIEELKPIQERRRKLGGETKRMEEIVREGAEYCRQIAKETLVEVKEKMGLSFV